MSVAFIRSSESVSKTDSLVVSASSGSLAKRGPLGRGHRASDEHRSLYKHPFVRKIAAGACLWAFPLSAQQASTALSVPATTEAAAGA